MLVLYLSNRYIRAVEGKTSGNKITVKNVYTVEDTSGCILNGTVMDPDGLKNILSEMWKTCRFPKKGVHLVIDGSQFTTKITDVPLLKPKKLMQFVSREFTNVERIEEPVYGYYILGKEKGAKTQKVFATMASRVFLNEYRKLFSEIGVTIEEIECAQGALIRMFANFSHIRNSVCVMQIVDDMSMQNILISSGQHVYSNRMRLFSDTGSVSYAIEVARYISNILQFAKAQNLTEQIEDVYIAGLDEELLEIYSDSVRQIDENLRVERMALGKEVRLKKNVSTEQDLLQYVVPLAGLFEADVKNGLVASASVNVEKQEKRRSRRKVLIPLGVLTAVLLAVSGVLGMHVYRLNKQIKEIDDYIENPKILQICADYDSLSTELRIMNTLYNSIEGLKTSVLEYPRVDSEVEEIVYACAEGLVNAEISSYDSVTGILTFNTTASRVEEIHQFVDLLTAQEIFAAVDYTGYTQNTDDKWSVRVNCTMADRREDTDGTEIDSQG